MPTPQLKRPVKNQATEVAPNDLRPTVLEINLDAVASNFNTLAAYAGNLPLLGVVKANAYGMGAIQVARTLQENGAAWLGVAMPEEGAQLRNAGLDLPILLLGPVAPRQIPFVLRHRITPAVHSVSFLEALEREAQRRGIKVKAHIKVDSGMGRVGFRPEELGALIKTASLSPHVELAGLFSNLASADNPSSPQTARQLDRFLSAERELRRGGIAPRWVHLANSSGLLSHQATRLTLCRPGLTLYGLLPSEKLPDIGLVNAISFKTIVSQVKKLPVGTPVGYGATYVTPRPMRIAILPVGYADGLPRALSNGRGSVLVNGAFHPIVGRVSMDLIAIDLSGAERVKEWDTVTLWGREGDLSLTPWDWARLSDTIPYEIMTGISNRVARRYTYRDVAWNESELI